MKADVAVAEWPERFPRPAASTTANNASQAKHFGTFFAGRELESITREEFYRYGQVHPGAARYARTMLGDYAGARLIEENVAEGVTIPRRPTKKVIVPTAEEIDLLVKHADRLAGEVQTRNDGLRHLGRMIQVGAYTALREGELRALAKPDIIFRDGEKLPSRLNVEFSIDRGEQLKDPKTASSEATCAILTKKTKSAVYGAWSLARRQSSPTRPLRLFPITRSQRQRAWEMTRRRAGVSVTWHSLRHFCATWLLDNGAAIDDVALQLRCSVEEVRETYGHPNREAGLQRLEVVADA